jgi:hypothetical protein
MPNRLCRLAALAATLTILTVAGCSKQDKSLKIPPQANGEPSERGNAFTYMVDNAMLEDSTIADVHFEPHTAQLSGLGVKRVARMGELLSTCGGTIHYETASIDEEFVEARLESVREFLATFGFDAALVTVEAGAARSTQLTAMEAIEIKAAGLGGDTEDAAGNTEPTSTGR